MTLLTVYETLSEVKQSRRNKLEVGRAGLPPRWSMIKHQCQCFFSVLWQPLTAWCLGFFIRKRKEEGMDPKQSGFHKQYSPNDFMWADTVLSGYQDNTIFFYLPQLPATQIPSPGMYEEFLSTAINFQRDLGDPTASFLLENILNKVNLWPDFAH